MLPALRESMSGTDLAWLRMERPTNPMMVVGVMTFATRLRLADLRALLASRLLRFERFRELPRSDIGGTHWEADPNFDLNAHLHALTLRPRATQKDLETAVGKLASTPLDPHLPLWQMHLIERFRKGSALIARFHHCYADGIALLRVIGELMDDAPCDANAPEASAQPGTVSGIPLVGPAFDFVQSLGGAAVDVVSASLHALTHPLETAAVARQVSNAAAELARIATLSDDPPTLLRHRLSTHKRVAWAEPLSLQEVKTIAHALDCTVNDVLLATVAGAIGKYMSERQPVAADLTVRALVPVNMRAADAAPTLGNRFGLVFASLPIGERNPLARLLMTHRDMQQLKTSAQPLMSLWLLAGMGLLPNAIEEQAIEVFTRKASLVISNVPGPQQPLHLAGARIEQELFWVPQAGSIGVGISLLTYDGRVNFGVMSDANVITDPERVAALFAAEFEKLLLCVVLHATPPSPRRRRGSPHRSIP
jgi:WS/DGAT/MGAT family acyltransferase